MLPHYCKHAIFCYCFRHSYPETSIIKKDCFHWTQTKIFHLFIALDLIFTFIDFDLAQQLKYIWQHYFFQKMTENPTEADCNQNMDDNEYDNFEAVQKPCYLSPNEIELPSVKYEYLDHTADVQIHARGDSLIELFEQCGMALFGYMTELDYVDIKQCYEIRASGSDLESLLYKYLDELLFLFCAEPNIVCRYIKITELRKAENGDGYRIKCLCYGEEFEIGRHPQGTEVKAITYSAMQIVQDEVNKNYEAFVIIDI